PASPDIAVYTKMSVYRDDGTGTYKFVGQTNAVASGTTSFTDNVRSTSLGGNLDEGDLDLGGGYNYFVTFANANLESRPAPLTTTESVSIDGHRIAIDNLPSSSSGLFDTVKIYRNTKDEPGNYYLVDSLPMGTQSYIDNKTDSAIHVTSNLLDRN